MGLTFKSLIHFEFISVYGVRKWSSFIFLHIAVQFFQHHLLKTSSLYILDSFVVNLVDYKSVDLFLRALFCFIYLCVFAVPYCFDYYSFLVWFETRKSEVSKVNFICFFSGLYHFLSSTNFGLFLFFSNSLRCKVRLFEIFLVLEAVLYYHKLSLRKGFAVSHDFVILFPFSFVSKVFLISCLITLLDPLVV